MKLFHSLDESQINKFIYNGSFLVALIQFNQMNNVNPLLPDFFFFFSVFKRKPKIGSYRLPTPRCVAHINFF